VISETEKIERQRIYLVGFVVMTGAALAAYGCHENEKSARECLKLVPAGVSWSEAVRICRQLR